MVRWRGDWGNTAGESRAVCYGGGHVLAMPVFLVRDEEREGADRGHPRSHVVPPGKRSCVRVPNKARQDRARYTTDTQVLHGTQLRIYIIQSSSLVDTQEILIKGIERL